MKSLNKSRIDKHALLDRGMSVILHTAQWFAAKASPWYARRHHAEIEKNFEISAWDGYKILVDFYRPQKSSEMLPVAFLIHGGGFRFFSKESHALVAARLAELGYLTVVIDYRLSPPHAYPSALIDALSVYEWIVNNIHEKGGDPQKIVLVGDSAGANLALGLSMIACGWAAPPEPFVDKASVISQVIPFKSILHCGYYHVSNAARMKDLPGISKLVQSRVLMIQRNYLPDSVLQADRMDWGLADPLLLIEKKVEAGSRDNVECFPPVFIPVGANDPVLENSERLQKAFEKIGIKSSLKIYPDSPHSFYTFPMQRRYEELWADIKGFLET